MPSASTTTRCEICENCYKHVESVHCKLRKNCNGRHTPRLLTCARCKEVRYCSRECQRLQWKEHKSPCDTQVSIVACLEVLGDKVSRTFKGLVRFAKELGGYLETPAISALELHKGKDRVENYVFLITVRAKETIFRESARGIKGCITFKVENARSVTMDYMHQWLDYRSGPFYTPESVDRTLAHRKGLMRIYIHDVSGILPPPLDAYTLPTDISNWPPTYHKRYDPDWRRKFYESIGQRSPEYAFDWTDFEGGDEDELRALAKIPPARPSTPTDEGKDMYDVLILEAAHERAPSPASDSGNSSTEFTKHRDSRDRRSSTASDDFTPDTSRSVSPCGEAYIENLPSRSTSPVAY